MNLQTEPLLETIYTSASIHQFLFSGKERMALGTDIHFEFFLGGTRFKGFSTDATDNRFTILGMDLFFHNDITSSAHTAKGFKARIP
jgi:hypothetical protein